MNHTPYPIACMTCGQCAFCDPLGCSDHGGQYSGKDRSLPEGVTARCDVFSYTPRATAAVGVSRVDDYLNRRMQEEYGPS